MPKHRGLTLAKFVAAIPPDLLESYFQTLRTEERPSGMACMNAGALQVFLDEPKNAQARGVILEDFRRINDICEGGTSLLVRAYGRCGLGLPKDKTPQAMAMRLFLHHREAFDYAWMRYLVYKSPSKLSLHKIDGDGVRFEGDKLDLFKEDVRQWFSDLAKGDVTELQCFDDEGEVVMLVRHGSYIRTVAYWDGDKIELRSFRPASEDILLYSPREKLLRIKASLGKDRDQYLRSFASCVVGDPNVADAATTSQIFTLAPLQEGRFDFGGDSDGITRIDLLKVRLKLPCKGDPVVEVKSGDLMQTFARDLPGLSLASGELTFARFRFHLQPNGEKEVRVTFEIEPPMRTDLAQRRYSDIIERYLVEQGVKLI